MPAILGASARIGVIAPGASPLCFPALESPAMDAAVFDRVAEIFAETGSIPREKITPEAHVIEDLGIDSLDFLDIVFALDKEFGIKIPVESWMQKVDKGEAKAEDFFVMKSLVARIGDLVAAKTPG